MKPFSLRTLTLPAVLAAALALGACNTIEGVGEDVQAGGKGIEKGAKSVKKKL